MNKSEAIEIFGSGAAVARAIGVTRGRVSQWPEKLDQHQTDRVLGAVYRLGMTDKLPKKYRQQQAA